MSVDNVYSFTVQRQNSADMPPGKSPCVKIKFIKDESVPTLYPKFKIGNENLQKEKPIIANTSISDEIKSEYKIESPGSLSIPNIYANESSSACMKRLLTQLHAIIQKRDTSSIFAVPVNEDHAPNYSAIITRPMDLRTIRAKVDNNTYRTIAQMLDDIILMLHNALIYNESNTVYHRIASQLLNFTKKSFSKDHLNKFVQSKLSWHRALTGDEIGNIADGLQRISTIQNERPKTRPNRIIHKNPHLDFITKRRRSRSDNHSTSSPKRQCIRYDDNDSIVIKEESDVDESFNNNAQSEESSIENESDDDIAEDILYMAQRAAKKAKERLKKSKQRPIVYFDKKGDDMCIVNAITGSYTKMGVELNNMVKNINSINFEQLLSDNSGCLSQVHQLCYDSNECVTLTTSKPLEPYSCAEQAVLVETFGNVITAEYACNMHNYVLELPSNSAAVELVKSRLNVATNYLTYGVDQIITKKLRAFNKL